MVKDILPGGLDSYPRVLADVDGTLFFAAYDGPVGTELWKSDGTEAGTVVVVLVTMGGAMVVDVVVVDVDDPGIVVVVVVVDVVVVVGEPG